MVDPRKIQTSSLRPNELEAVYTISKVVAEPLDVDDALDEIIILARDVFIFDNAVLYLQEDDEVEPVFARALGRGRKTPAEIAWGDVAAKGVFRSSANYLYQSKIDNEALHNRLDRHFLLGLPMFVDGKVTGALVFVRFGGPAYSEDQINLAEFVAIHVSQLFERQWLFERVANLEAERRLVQLQSDFIAMVSHELKTPLGFIKGYTTTLLRQDTEWDEETRSEFLNIIDEEADRLSELIENLLDSSRLQSGTLPMDFKSVCVDELVLEIMERLQARYSRLDYQLDVGDIRMYALLDTRRVAQVLENLVANVSKYAPGSTVRVSLAMLDEGYAHLVVGDDGPGIPEEHLPHLFKRFYRVPQRSAGVRGTGLGLFICKQIMQAHGGEIIVKSKLDIGTSFYLTFPLVEGAYSEVKND